MMCLGLGWLGQVGENRVAGVICVEVTGGGGSRESVLHVLVLGRGH